MHELSICTSLATLVEQHANGRRVARVHVNIGHLSQVVPPTLEFSWQVVTAETPLEGAELVINHIPAVLTCSDCGASTTITVPVFRCSCGSTAVTLVSGRELDLAALDLESPST